jgi:hypothetical protein
VTAESHDTQTARINRGRNHSYLLDGHKVRGVTSIIGDGLPKPALIAWAANTTAEYAIDHWTELDTEAPSKRLAILKNARYGERDAAARRGTEVHALAAQLVDGTEVDVPEPLAGHVESYLRFLDDWQPEPVIIERPVFSRRHRYAGTLDMIADLTGLGRGLWDVKTTRSGVFGEVALQLAAYRWAEFYLDDNGNEMDMPEVDHCGVIWVRADGYDLIPVEAGPAQFRTFLYTAQVAQFNDTSRDLIGEALTPPRLQENAS